MLGLVFGGELLQDVALINLELFGSMSKCEKIGVTGEIECDGPISMRRDRFRSILRSEFEFDLTDGFSTLVVGGRGVEAREDVVEVNGFPLNKVEPFAVGKRWASRCIDDTQFNLLEVD